MTEYLAIFILLVVAILFPIVALIFTRIVQAEKESKVKLEPYECGIETEEQARDRYSVRYYIISVLFSTRFLKRLSILLSITQWVNL